MLSAFSGITAIAENDGKTTLASCATRLTHRSLLTNNDTTACLSRLIDMCHGAAVLDEMDTLLGAESKLYAC